MTTGQPNRLLALLQRVWTYAITTKSDYARDYADEIAQGASAGFLTTQVAPGPYDPESDIFGRLWKITPSGLNYLWERSEEIAEEENAAYLEANPVAAPCRNCGGYALEVPCKSCGKVNQ